MKVLILGSGVVGVTAAYYLASAGHAVTVIDRQSAPAAETSFANGGQISASLAEPWANPEVVPTLLRWLGRKDAPLVFHWRADPTLFLWGVRFLRNCTAKRSAVNLERALRIALYSRAQLGKIREDTGITYDEQTNGIVKIYRERRSFDLACRRMSAMNAFGTGLRALDREACLALEPALAPSAEQIVGAIHAPEDESGDAHCFTIKLAEEAGRRGVRFLFGETVERLLPANGRIERVMTNRQTLSADAIVLSLGSESPLLLRPLGIRLPVYPAKGYSVTFPLRDDKRAPSRSITDEDKKLVFVRLGDRLRVAGQVEFAGYDRRVEARRCKTLTEAMENLFPGAADLGQPQGWAGLRPLTPDTLPVIGPTRFSNLFLNTGHGTYGWTMAAGSGRILADLVEGRRPEIRIEDFGLDRF